MAIFGHFWTILSSIFVTFGPRLTIFHRLPDHQGNLFDHQGTLFLLENGFSYPGVVGALVCVVQFIARNVFLAVVLFGELPAGRRNAAFVNLRTNFPVVQFFANIKKTATHPTPPTHPLGGMLNKQN